MRLHGSSSQLADLSDWCGRNVRLCASGYDLDQCHINNSSNDFAVTSVCSTGSRNDAPLPLSKTSVYIAFR